MNLENTLIDVACIDCGKIRTLKFRYGRDYAKIRCQPCAGKHMRTVKKWGATHDESKTPLYRVWSAMKARCLTATSQSYAQYGGRGIKLCMEWLEFTAFRDWAMSHGYAKGLLIDRRNNDGGYEPSNCRWVTSEISANNRSTTKLNIVTVALARELASWGLQSKFVGVLLGMPARRVSDIKHGKKFRWVNPTMLFEVAG